MGENQIGLLFNDCSYALKFIKFSYPQRGIVALKDKEFEAVFNILRLYYILSLIKFLIYFNDTVLRGNRDDTVKGGEIRKGKE